MDGLVIQVSGKEIASHLRAIADAVESGGMTARINIALEPASVGYSTLEDPPGTGVRYKRFVTIEAKEI